MATILEDFEDETLNLTITGTWARDDDFAAFGSWSLKSGAIANFGTTDALVTIPAQATSLSFYYRVSSEPTYDKLTVLIDGVDQAITPNSGEVPWTQKTLDVTGKSQVTFRYTKDVSDIGGSDAAWVDQITFITPATEKSSTDSGTLTETASTAQVPEIAKASSDIGQLIESRWVGEPQATSTPASIRSTSTVASGSSSYTINAPAGVVANDVLIGIQAADRGTTAVMTTPTGGTTWELLDSLDAVSQGGVTQVIRVWWKRAGSAEPGTYTFKQQGASDGVCLVVAVKDASLTAIPKIVRLAADVGVNVTTPGIVPSSDRDLEIRLAAGYALNATVTFTQPVEFTPLARVQSRGYTVVAAASRSLQSAAGTGPVDFVPSAAPLEWRAGYTLAIAPAVTGPPQQTKAASDSGAVVESSTVFVQPDGVPKSASDTATLTEAAATVADVALSDVATLGETAAIDAGPGATDQATLAEATMLLVGWGSSDQATLTDAVQVDAQTAATDTGALAELVDIAKTIGPVATDAATLAEVAAVESQAAAADSGTLAEGSMLQIGRSGVDQAQLAEIGQVDAQATSADSGSLAESVDIVQTLGPVSNDGGALVEAAAVDVQVTSADTGALAESATAAVVKEADDSGRLAETVSIGLATSDSALFVERAAVDASTTATDSAAIADQAVLQIPKSAVDAAALVEHAEVVDIGRDIVGVGIVRRSWSAHSPRRRWAAGKPRRAWRADSPHT